MGKKMHDETHATWTRDDDSEILKYVYDRTKHDKRIFWQNLSALFGGANRTARSANERWVNQLDPSILRNPWSPQEI